ncbi:MAG: hypothetical protein KF699_11150 [Phycisphaeraceae bacterium]|nr:hypothetical protein [Phycisphaeraceae bacterium]MBX3407350.1 hypothetical protein [Phycisphaeraceae bacterium]
MTPTTSRLLLSMIFLCAQVSAYLVLFNILYMSTPWDEFQTHIYTGVALHPVGLILWPLIWVRAVRWTSLRIVATLAWTAGSLLLAGAVFVGWIILAAVTGWMDEDYASAICVPLAMILWPLGTVFIWQDRLGDRAARSRAAQREGVKCPGCGYALSDIRSTTCPECGRTFTVRELVVGGEQSTVEREDK